MNRARLNLQTLEARDVPAFVAALDATGNATFTGDAGADALEIFLSDSGGLSHNRFTAGDPGFESDFDFDSSSPGNQFLRVNAGASTGDVLITVTDAGFNNDVLRYSNGIRGQSGQGDTFTFAANSLHHATDSDENNLNLFDVRFSWDASLREIQLFGTGGSDTVLVVGQPNPNQALRIDAGGGENDGVFIGDDGPFLTGSLDGLAGRINVVAAEQTRVLDQLSSSGATYTVTTEGIARTKAGHPDLFVQLDAGFAGILRLETSDGDDTVLVTGVPFQVNNLIDSLPIFTGGGVDTVTVRPDRFTEVNVVGSGNDRLIVDAAGLAVQSFDPIPDGRVRTEGRRDVRFLRVLSAQLLNGSLPPAAPAAVPGGDLLAVAGAGTVRVFNGDGSLRFELPLGGFAGTPFVATGDVTGDGIDDVFVGLAAGNAPLVGLFDGATGALLLAGEAFENAFRGGVSVALGDLTGDGRAELLVGTASGGGRVRAFDLHGGGLLGEFVPLPGIGDGVALAAADLTGDGIAEVLVGAARGSSAVRAFDVTRAALAFELLAFGSAANGVSLGAGDLDGDGIAEVLVGSLSVGSRVLVLGATGAPRAEFDAFPGFADGVSVAAHDRTGDGRAEVLVGANGTGAVRVFGGDPLAELLSFGALPPGTGPIVVG